MYNDLVSNNNSADNYMGTIMNFLKIYNETAESVHVNGTYWNKHKPF